METRRVCLIYFSPTKTSKKVGDAIAKGFVSNQSCETKCIDLTLHNTEAVSLAADDLAVFVVPVYGGHVAPLAMKRMENISGTNTPAVVVVVYGNRAYEKSLVELDSFVLYHGFKTIAAATFIGEHSFHSSKFPIAAGRPDADDLQTAEDFGERIHAKILNAIDDESLFGINVERIARPKQPFWPLLGFLRKVIALRKSGTPIPKAPVVKEVDACTHCGACAEVCPTGAILKGSETKVDADKCIKCCACVKACPHQLRVYDTPFAGLLSRYFVRQKLPQTLL